MYIHTTTSILTYAVKSHTPGLTAHHCGCSGIAFTPRATMRNCRSCKRGSAVSEPAAVFRCEPSGSVAPVQKTSAEVAARGQAMGSRFEGPDCSVQRSCSPVVKMHDEKFKIIMNFE